MYRLHPKPVKWLEKIEIVIENIAGEAKMSIFSKANTGIGTEMSKFF